MNKAKMGPRGGVYVISKNGNKIYLKPDTFYTIPRQVTSSKSKKISSTCGSYTKKSCSCGCSKNR